MEQGSDRKRKGGKKTDQPYMIVKELSESLEGYCWNEETLTLLPEIDSKPPELELPLPDCTLAVGYYPGEYMVKTNGEELVDPPSADIDEVILHALYENKKIKEAPLIITRGFQLEGVLREKSEIYAPLMNNSGILGHTKAQVTKHVRTEVKKHLNSIPFLNLDKVGYWEFAIRAYEKFQLSNLLQFIIDEGKKKKWVGDADPTTHPGWSILSFKGLVQMAHMYPPIKDSGAKLSFKVVQLPTGYYLREILLSLTSTMEPARRSKPLLTYQNLTGNDSEYGEWMNFSENLLFKKKKKDEGDA